MPSTPEASRERAKAWYYDNRERALASRKALRDAKTPEERRAERRANYEQGKDRQIAQMKRYYRENKPAILARMRKRIDLGKFLENMEVLKNAGNN